ncbi:DUF6602 domain-containing protein [Phycisphaerales bacterium AB-hyl4]|uniref:DUF6602 domain-containing protein n=1 Tax=Natronomicrosphaera hydrolytica TaxID=3242702 RepID=A0ABV4U8N7_9BACT
MFPAIAITTRRHAMTSNSSQYLASVAYELSAQATRVRDLIGDKHWLSDGHHHEALLRDLIRRHIGHSCTATRGFVIDPVDINLCSREQDILIIDERHESPFFQQNDLAIAFPRQVIAAISVKASLNSSSLKDAIEGLSTARFISNRSASNLNHIWTAAFFFDTSKTVDNTPSLMYKYVANSLNNNHPSAPNRRITCEDLPDFICAGQIGTVRSIRTGNGIAELSGSRCANLSPAVFLGVLLDHLASSRGLPMAHFAEFIDNMDFPPLTPQSITLNSNP